MRCAGSKLLPSFEVIILIFMPSLVFGQSQTAVVPSAMDHILYGAAYYHEYMPYERLDKDVALMQQAGLNVVRMGESTWSLWEPEEGQFEYAWMDRVVEAMGKAGIKVIMGTPTYSIPYLAVSRASRSAGPAAGWRRDVLRHAPEHGYG